MKVICAVCLTVVILCLGDGASAGFEKFADAVTSARQKLLKKDYAGARQDATEAVALARSQVEKIRAATLLAQIAESAGDFAAARTAYERILADKGSDNKTRIAALSGIAGVELDAGRIEAARAAVQQAMAMPDLKPDERLTALTNLGAVSFRLGEYAAAREAYQRMRELDRSDKAQAAVDALMTAAWVAEGDFASAIALNRQAGRALELARVYRKQNNPDAARAQLRAILAEQAEQASPAAVAELLQISKEASDFATARADAEAYLVKRVDRDPSRAAELLGLLKEAMQVGNYAFASWAAPIVQKAPKLSDRDATLARLYQVNALAALGKTEEARGAAQAAGAEERLPAADRLRFRLTAAALGARGEAGEMQRALEQTVTAGKPADFSVKDQATLLLNVAKTALLAGKEPAARELHALYQRLLPAVDRRTYVCEFMARAPCDPGAWLASPMLKELRKRVRLDRKVSGENLESLLATDAIGGGRGVSAAGQAQEDADTATDLYMTCDVYGIHVLLLASDSRAGEVASALASGGSYEGYLSVGRGEPYYCFLVDLPSGVLHDGMQTMYPNRHFRAARQSDRTIKSLTTPTEGGFATYLFFAWELFYDRLPEDGTAWQFETIRWTRTGGFSWAGSQSVHNHSSWGDLVFRGLTEQARREIKRRLIFKAHAKYQLEKSHKAQGAIAHWQDVELGDAAFYQASLAPWVARLDALGKKVTKDLGDADAELLFAEAVPDWMEFKYRADELRRQYLSDKFFR